MHEICKHSSSKHNGIENQLRLAGIEVALIRQMAFQTNVFDESQAQDIIQTEDSDSQAALPGRLSETSYSVGAEAKTFDPEQFVYELKALPCL